MRQSGLAVSDQRSGEQDFSGTAFKSIAGRIPLHTAIAPLDRGAVIGYTIAHSRAKAPEHGMVCGRGGIGRRAALRSLSGNTGGSSSLLDRTMSFGGDL